MKPLPIELDASSSAPFYRQMQEQITALIQSGQLPPGTRLPSVRELSRTTLVSLITIRRAYAELDQAGLIVRKQGQGTFVAERDPVQEQLKTRALAREALRQAVLGARTAGLDEDAIWGVVARSMREPGG
jgi:GntR family transcriptional regulator